MKTYQSVNNKSVIILKNGDITQVDSDAIVNAANTSLLGGGGVDGAIHRVGGKLIVEECQKIRNKQGGCRVSEAVITTGGNLKAKFVIHTVGPIWNGGNKNEDDLLFSAYVNCLKLATQHNIQTIAFPNVSTGIYKFPKTNAAKIAVKAVLGFLRTTDKILEVTFVCFDLENYNIYENLLENTKCLSSISC